MEAIAIDRKYCPDCKAHVQAEVRPYNPDNIDEGLIWQCTQCGNAIELFGE